MERKPSASWRTRGGNENGEGCMSLGSVKPASFAARLYPTIWRDYWITKPSSNRLQAYFASGWVFLMPYLAAYLLYAWLKWPVNPGRAGEGVVKGMSESVGATASLLPAPCSLLHLYWFLHALHLILGSLALRAWWLSKTGERSTEHGKISSFPPSPLSLLLNAAPWLCLSLLFYIPGVYLEWPSDPWEHLRRINEWHILDQVTAHSSWKKSSYFLPYSLTGHTTGLDQLSWLNFYYTGVCLLLSWQYYRLARAVGLGERASFIFVLLNALTFGNNIFSFYRYYGLSSSIFAQIGAVALTRIALEALRPREQQVTLSVLPSPFSLLHRFSHLPSSVSGLLQFVLTGFFLLPLIALNHIQGLGIAGLGVLAVVVWRLIEWKRTMAIWLPLTAVLASVAVVRWFPRHPALDEIYRPHGWLTMCYGFNLFSPSSPAFERSIQIFGYFGLINLGASLWLLRRNYLAGWLTLMPLLALILPCFALPFAHVLAAHSLSPDNIVTFHRFLFAVPTGLALAAALSHFWYASTSTSYHYPATNVHTSIPYTQSFAFAMKQGVYEALALIAILLGPLLSPGKSTYNRTWNTLEVVPNDLQLAHLNKSWTPATIALANKDSTLVSTSRLGEEVQFVFRPSLYLSEFRQINAPLDLLDLELRLARIKYAVGASEIIAEKTNAPADLVPADTSWVTFSGSVHQFKSPSSSPIIYNSPGVATSVFNSELIPVSTSKRYLLRTTIRQLRSPAAINHLAVIWYDHERRLLESHRQQPEGAGSPTGWSNGTYSYYGLIAESAPTEWSEYSIAFGLGKRAAIPPNAAYMRVGALINYNETPEAEVQITKLSLQETPILHHLILFPLFHELYSPASQAGLLSGHWQVQRVLVDHSNIK